MAIGTRYDENRSSEVVEMELRSELMPPALDEAKVRRLAELASRLDGADPGQSDHDLAEFNRIAGTDFSFEVFQRIYESEAHQTWVRRILVRRAVRSVANVTSAELVEVVRRAMPQNGYSDFEAYMAIVDANVPLRGGSNLILYPRDYDPSTNTWGGGRPMGEYDPSPEQIVEKALAASGD
jgi:hypothetical protein